MAFLGCDGFDSYAAISDITKKGWAYDTSGFVWDGTAGITGGGCLKNITGTAGKTFFRRFKVAATGITTLCAQFWVKIAAAPSAAFTLLNTSDDFGGNHTGGLGVTTGGFLALTTSVSATQGVVTATQLCDNVWHHVEVVLSKNSNGGTSCTYSVWVDGAQLYSAAAQGSFSVSNNGMSVFYIGSGNTNIFIDDPIWWNETGSGLVTTTGIGIRRIDTLRPSGAGNSTQFAPDSGSNYARVSETNADDDTSYVTASTSGNKDTYAFGDLGSTPATITAVVVNARARTDPGKTASIKLKARTSTTENTPTAQALGPAYAVKQEYVATDPTTTAAWIGSGINGAEFGIEVA